MVALLLVQLPVERFHNFYVRDRALLDRWKNESPVSKARGEKPVPSRELPQQSEPGSNRFVVSVLEAHEAQASVEKAQIRIRA